MRLFVRSKIYRAFPELDAFSDERCERFVRAARRPLWFRARVYAFGLFAFGLATAAVIAAIVLAEENHRDIIGPRSSVWEALLGVVAILLGYCIAGVTALWVRDWLLRRRIRRVLRVRGRCHSCGYLLAGVTVNAANEVACPECGFTTAVDPALGELASDEKGRTEYRPSEASLRNTPFGLSVTAWQRVRRWALRLTLGALALIVLVVGGWEVFLRYQAVAASAVRPHAAGLREFQLTQEPRGLAADAPNSWDAFGRVYGEFLIHEQSVLAAHAPPTNSTAPVGAPSTRYSYIEYSFISDEDGPEQGSQVTPEDFQIQRADALKAIDLMEHSTLFKDMREMVDRPRHIWAHDWPVDNPAWELLMPQLGQVRRMSRMLRARMDLTAKRDDAAVFAESLHLALGLSHMCKTQPSAIEWLVGQAIESLGLSRSISALCTPRDARWLDAIEPEAWRTLDHAAPYSVALDGEVLMSRDAIGWLFEDPSRVRFGRFSKAVMDLQAGSPDEPLKPLGTLWENLDEKDRYFKALKVAADHPPWQRATPPASIPRGRLAMSSFLEGSPDRLIAPLDQGRVQLAGLITMIRIERYRLAHDHYPQSLAEVQADSPRPLPVDPYSGKLLGYMPVDPATDPFGRHYILYSVGPDLKDDHARSGSKVVYSAGEVAPDDDFIINDPRR